MGGGRGGRCSRCSGSTGRVVGVLNGGRAVLVLVRGMCAGRSNGRHRMVGGRVVMVTEGAV